MIPVLSHTEQSQDLSVWITTDNKIGAGFEIKPCDLESNKVDEYYQSVLSFLRSVDSTILSRVKMSVSEETFVDGSNPRNSALAKLGHVQKRFFIYVETFGEFNPIERLKEVFTKHKRDLDKDFQALLKVKEALLQSGLEVKPLPQEQLIKLFERPNNEWRANSSHIDTGTERVGIIRLTKQHFEELNEEALSDVLDLLPKPFEVSVSVLPIPEAKAKFMLERRLKQFSAANDPTAKAQGVATAQTIVENLKSGTRYFEFEFLVLLRRDSEAQLTSDLRLSQTLLNSIAEFKIETFGTAPSYVASLPGGSQHVPLIEQDKPIPLYLPVWARGQDTEGQSPGVRLRQSRVLSLHRKDSSLLHFDLFNPSYNVFNTLVIGTSGKGKSVLTGLITQSLLNDPNVSVIKVDVGGSHSKECKMFGGSEFVMKLDQPSGINPFKIAESKLSQSEKVAILSKFLGVLIQEQGEIQMSKELRSEIEESVFKYLDSNPTDPNLNDFFSQAKNFPRRKLLARWVMGGVYSNSFSTSSSLIPLDSSHSRLRYYNFSQIFQASDPEFAQAGIAAVLAQFNFETLTNKNKRIVLICDETPFFIRSCFEFFKFSTANVRKYGHAVIMITQLSSDLIVNGDTGIIENSPQRFLFSVDGNKETYRERFGLNDRHMKSIESLRSVPGEYSETFFQTGSEGRKLTIKITPLEYWRLTTTKSDQEKLEKLLMAVPELKMEEAIKCLSLI